MLRGGRLVAAPSALDARHITGTETALPPTLGTPVVPVGRQARDAYAAAMRRMFSGAGGTPSARLAPAASAARAFEAEFERPPALAGWLTGLGGAALGGTGWLSRRASTWGSSAGSRHASRSREAWARRS